MAQLKLAWQRWEVVFVSVVFLAGLALRLKRASTTYLDPDEIQVALIALSPFMRMLHRSLVITHPPLLVLVTYVASRVSRTEVVLRLIPVVTSSVFPVLLFLWLRRAAGRIAAIVALVVLALSPHMIVWGSQIRPYALALFFVSACLLTLDLSLERDRWQLMALYSVLLWVCILSDYSTAWFVGAAGFYALIRIRGRSDALKICWAAGQLLAVLLYAGLYLIQVRRFRGSFIEHDALTNWLRDSFPRHGDLLAFPFTRTPAIFKYLLAPLPLGGYTLILFVAAVYLLWTRRARVAPGRARALALLLALPFVLALGGAYAHEFPYGGTRHTLVLGLFAAVGIAIFVETLPGTVAGPLVCGMVLLAPLWALQKDQGDIPDNRSHKQQILDTLSYMRATIPAGQLVLMDAETIAVLSYYSGETNPRWEAFTKRFSDHLLCDRWRVATRDFQYATPAQLTAALGDLRRQYQLNPNEAVWVVDGGWLAVAGPPDEKLPFTNAVRVTRMGGN